MLTRRSKRVRSLGSIASKLKLFPDRGLDLILMIRIGLLQD
jgi:hypothetical protein